MAKKHTIVVDRHAVQHNRKHPEQPKKAALSVAASGERVRKGFTAILFDANGVEVGRFVYNEEKPLHCGATVWFETRCRVEMVDEITEAEEDVCAVGLH